MPGRWSQINNERMLDFKPFAIRNWVLFVLPRSSWFRACKRYPINICGSHSSEQLFQTLPLAPQCNSHAHPPRCLVLKLHSHRASPSVSCLPMFFSHTVPSISIEASPGQSGSFHLLPGSLPFLHSHSRQPSPSLSVDSLSSRHYCCSVAQ